MLLTRCSGSKSRKRTVSRIDCADESSSYLSRKNPLNGDTHDALDNHGVIAIQFDLRVGEYTDGPTIIIDDPIAFVFDIPWVSSP